MSTIDVKAQLSQSGMAMLREYWEMAVRRKWVIIGSIILSLTAAGLYCKLSTKLYRSETLILVEEQKIPENVVQGVVEGNLEHRFIVIQKQIMSRTLLGEIVKEFNLYPDDVAQYGLDEAIGKVGKTLRVEMVTKVPGAYFVSGSSIDAFTVSFSHEDPGTAMSVTSAIVSKFIVENLEAREQIAQSTTEFIDYEVGIAKSELERKEDEISQFKSKHMGELPQQIEVNLRALDRQQSDLNSVNEAIQRLSDRLALVENGIEEYQRFGHTNSALNTRSVGPDPLFRHLKELRDKLVKLKAEFWDTYPDVLLTKEEISQVEKELVELYGPDSVKPGENPLDPYLQDLKKQQSEVKSELTLLNQRQHLLHAEKKDYEKRVENAPSIEQELLILLRDYDNMKDNYRSLLDKRLNAMVAENLEKRQKGGQFRIIDPANFPRVPEKPNQLRIMIFGLIFGCTLGVGMAVMQEQLNPQFRRPEDIEHMLGPQLLAVIPDFTLAYGQLRWQRFLPNYHLIKGANGHNGEGEVGKIRWPRLLGNGRANPPFEMNLVVKQLPGSIVAEQYRVAATRLALVATKQRSTIVAVTSAVKGEGKTTTVVNLGYTLAGDLGKRTLLVDCDFKCPVLNRYPEIVPEGGLADYLTGNIALDECLSSFGEVPCWIMPVGNCKMNSNELLKTERLAGCFAELREQFDYILINTPPILPLADMNVLARHADVLLLVVRAGSTPQQFVKRALSTLRADTPIHVILNAVGSQALPYYMYTDYYQQSLQAE
ncbi:MAG: GumC family protein [Nitrospiraceae bacterium]